MRSIRALQDIVDWGLCVGCGACYALCHKSSVSLKNYVNIGIRPSFASDICKSCNECLSICPGYRIDNRSSSLHSKACEYEQSVLVGRTVSVWEGFASDEVIRFSASSGGLLTAISLYCLEKKEMELVVHTGADPDKPWMNMTTVSRSREDLLRNVGSRYAASSPCEGVRIIEESSGPCVFIGKPCDTAALSALRQRRPKLDKNLGLVLTFCCAGVPSVRGSLDLLENLNVPKESIAQLSYRGDGWPGGFSVLDRNGNKKELLSYMESWHFLQKYRSFRCHLCPDGLGELCDISCGDAWHRFDETVKNPGLSIALARTELGHEVIRSAIDEAYVTLTSSNNKRVVQAQGLVERRKEVFGRQLAMKLLLVPSTKFYGFPLFRAWMMASPKMKIRSFLGTLRRLLQRGLWRRNRLADL